LGIGKNDDLAGVGRVGEDFLIARDGGIENHLSRPLDGRTKTTALEDRTVFQGEHCWVQLGFFLQTGGNFYWNTEGGWDAFQPIPLEARERNPRTFN
jgi:hypothetical protein